MKILEQLPKELSDFEKSYSLRLKRDDKEKLYTSKDKGYLYNQLAVLNMADYYFRGEFTSSKFDDEGQRMIFVNQLQFPVRVARKQVDIDVKDMILVPDTYNDSKKIEWVRREFQDWAKEAELGQVMNDLLDDYAKYGTCVYKRVGQTIERQPLHQLINTQDTKSLKDAATNGGYVIVKHELTPKEMEDFPDWEVPEDLDAHKKYVVYERYGLVDDKDLGEYNDWDAEDIVGDKVFAMSIILERGKDGDKVMFMEEMEEDDFPFGEAHWERDTGRWLGVGEAENQFENQVAKNLSANLRRRALLWASKKIFQREVGEELSLIKEVADGTVLEVGRGGGITQVNAQTQHLGDFQSFDQLIDDNSQKKSFTFESATGETLPSGTPFRLGVVLSQATNTHFNLKKENFGLMMDRMFHNHIVEIFKDTPKKDKLRIASDEEGVETLKESIIEYKADRLMIDALLNKPVEELLGLRFDKEEVKERVRAKIDKEPYMFIDIPKDYYDDLKISMSVEITGQYTNVEKEVETLSNILQLSIGNPQALNDPRIVKMIELITSKTGTSVKGLMGTMAQKSPELAGLANDVLTQQATNLNFNGGQNQATTENIA